MAPAIGVLALQGGFEAHARALAALGHEVVLVRSASALAACAGLVLPGGESTVVLRLLARAARYVAHPPIRARGTFCGSLAWGHPAAEWNALAVGLGGAFVLAALWFAYRWYLVVRPRRATAQVDPGTPLERALAVLRYAHETGDETLQRKAFERVAGELGIERADELTLIARELAWSQRTPEDEEVEEFAEQALGAQEDPS